MIGTDGRSNRNRKTQLKISVKLVPDVVRNLVSNPFSEPEINIPNDGLNYAVHQKHSKLEGFVVDVEASIKRLQHVEKTRIRREVK
jgi:hypothetical protein